MKESKFIQENLDKWKQFEDGLKGKHKNPEEISRLYVEITDDLAFSQTYYKNRSVRLYLNGAAQILFNQIYHNKKLRLKTVLEFWKIKLPVIMYQVRRELLISFLIFFTAAGIGILSSIYQPDFARFILGDSYVEMTIANIEKQDPMAVYKSMNEMDMFLGITLNNIKVAFITFVLGIFMAVGTVVIMIYNGIMVGTFQYFFIEHDLFWESFLTIWLHGTLEISSIIIAGAAGLTMGKGLLFPGSYSRFQSLRLSAKRGIKIMIGLIPIFIVAAFIEGFITRQTDVSYIIRGFLILISLVFVLYYFVIYPHLLAKKHPELILKTEKLGKTKKEQPRFDTILSGERLFSSAFQIIKSTAGQMIKLSFLTAILYSSVLLLFSGFFIPDSAESVFGWQGIKALLNYRDNRMLIFLNAFFCALILLRASLIIKTYIGKNTPHFTSIEFLKEMKEQGINALITSLTFNFVFFSKIGWGIVLFLVILPVILLAYYHSTMEDVFIIAGVDIVLRRLKYNVSYFIGQYFKTILICAIFCIVSMQFSWLITIIFEWNISLTGTWQNMIFEYIYTIIYSFIIFLSISAINISLSILYYNMIETATAEKLIARIHQIGNRNKIRGYETE